MASDNGNAVLSETESQTMKLSAQSQTSFVPCVPDWKPVL